MLPTIPVGERYYTIDGVSLSHSEFKAAPTISQNLTDSTALLQSLIPQLSPANGEALKAVSKQIDVNLKSLEK